MFIYKETHSSPHVLARRRRDAGVAAARLDGARADARAQDGGESGQTLRRHLASAWRGARILESSAGRPNFDFSFITKPLEPFRNRVTLITGLDMPEAMANEEEPGGDHARGAVLLSGARPRRNAVSPYLGVTIDQLIAEEIRPGYHPGVHATGRRG